MADHLAHFPSHAHDGARARTFHEPVFDRQFEPWGPPDSRRIRTGADAAAFVRRGG